MKVRRTLFLGGAVALGGLALTACFPTGLDPAFGVDGVQASPMSASTHDRFLAVTPGPSGTYYASGFVATGVGTDQAFALARFTAEGAFDATFGGGDGIATVNIAVGGKTVEQARGVAVQSDGKIVVSGAIEHDVAATGDAARDTDIAVARFDATGAPDPSFDGDGVKVLDLAPGFALDAGNYFGDLAWGVQSTTGNRTVVYGTKHAGPGRIDSDFYLAALEEDGDLDPTFGTGGVLQVSPAAPAAITFEYARNLIIEPDGQLVTAGYSLSLDGVTRPVLIRANANGTLDPGFGSGGWTTDTVLGNVAEAYKVGLQGDKYVATGYGKESASDTHVDLIVYRFNADGSRDLTFGTGGLVKIDEAGQDDRGRNLEILPGGRVLVVGSTKLSATDIDAFTVLLSADGQLDPYYDNNPQVLGEHGTQISDLGGTGDAWFGVTLSADATAIYAVGYKAGVSGGNDDAAIARISLLNPAP
jgi:uncharacterized delta-60 repeat protein